MQKITTYLKEEDNWGLINTIIKEQKTQKNSKAVKIEIIVTDKETTTTGRKAADLLAEKSILKHKELTGKWLKEADKKDWIKTNYKAVSILLSIISITNQQAVENLDYARNI